MELGPKQLAWVEALESGKYDQATHGLGCSQGFCCLGVACEINNLERREDSSGDYRYFHGDMSNGAYLPGHFHEELGLRNNTGSNVNKIFRSLAQMNDEGRSFADIAKTLREKPEQYFTCSK